MVRRGFAALTATCIYLLFISHAANAALSEISDLAAKAGPAVVNVSTVKVVDDRQQLKDFFRERGEGTPFEEFFDQFERFFRQPPDAEPRQERSLGSGFIISPDGYVVTNNHVIADADEINVNLQDAQKPIKAEVVGRDPETDLALLKIETDRDLPVLEFGDSDALRVGEWVVAIGNPFGLDHTVTAGIVSAKSRVIGNGPFDDFIQTDASINPGNSGGPLLNMDGQVVGINTAIVASGQGIGFAVPGTMAESIIEQLREHKQVLRGWIGVTIQDVDENTAKALDLAEPRGALVSSVLPGQPADQAGVKTGDVILAVNGKDVADAGTLTKAVADLPPGERIRLSIWRQGKRQTIRVTLGKRDMDKLTQNDATPAPSTEAALGLSLRPLDSQEANALGLEEPLGLVVTEVLDGSAAASGDVRPGDVIVQVNQKEVASVEQFDSIVAASMEKGVLLVLIKRQGRSIFRTINLNAE